MSPDRLRFRMQRLPATATHPAATIPPNRVRRSAANRGESGRCTGVWANREYEAWGLPRKANTSGRKNQPHLTHVRIIGERQAICYRKAKTSTATSPLLRLFEEIEEPIFVQVEDADA